MPRRAAPDPQRAKLGARLHQLRTERKMSLHDLADVSDVSKGHLSGVEHGLSAITVQTISRLAEGLDLRPLYLLASPADDERDYTAELVRKLPAHEVAKLRRELTRAAKEAAKEAAKAAAKATRKRA